MGKIVSIGGGSIGRNGDKPETTSIDKRIVELTGKSKPHFLFIPTASMDAPDYIEAFQKQYGKLGCTTDTLCLVNNPNAPKAENPDRQAKVIREKIEAADGIYVGGGNTLKMISLWKRLGVDKQLLKAHKRGAVMCGLSAGSVCWFRWGNSDSRKFRNPDADLIRVACLGLIDALNCPHYDVEEDRKPQLKKMMKRTPGVSIALDNCAAIQVVDEQYEILTSSRTAGAYRVYWKQGKFFEEQIKGQGALKALTSK